jgi:hypothetical protein
MASSGMLRRVALVRTDVSEETSAYHTPGTLQYKQVHDTAAT